MFSQCDSIKKFWMSLLEYLRGPNSATPAPEDLFKVDVGAEKLNIEKIEQHHYATAKCLCFSQRARVDMQIISGFHCTRVKAPDVQDWRKFRNLSGCLWAKTFLPLVISIKSEGDVCTCTDGTHAVHAGGKGHYGLFLTMGTR